MSAYDQGPIAKYNSLTDRHLMGYFSNDRMRRHLIKNGLITKGGEVVSDAVYRVRIARREHRRRVRDLIAQAIIHKALEMERSRQIDIRKKIEEIAKIELVRRVRTDCNRIGDEECLSYFNEGNMESKVRPKSGKSGKLKSRPDLEEARLPVTPDQESRQRLRKILPNEEIETKHLSQLDSLTLGEYARILEKHDQHRIDKLPYLGMGSEYIRHNFKLLEEKSAKAKKKKISKKSKKNEEGAESNVVTSARSSQTKAQAHTVVTILFHAPNNNRPFDVMVVQQPSGGNTLILYRESISNNTVFQVTSHRHKGFPFSLTFFIDNVKDSRISTCCEYKHKVGKKIGGPSGHFTLFSVAGDNPCFRCLAERDLANEKKENKTKDTKSNEQLNSRHETISVRSASEDRYKSDNDFEDYGESSSSASDEEEEEEEEEEEDNYEENGHPDSRQSSSSKNSRDNFISVNVQDQARSQTPEIEVNCEDSSEKPDPVVATSSNNNAIEGDTRDKEDKHHPLDEPIINSDRTSVWTGKSDQVNLSPKEDILIIDNSKLSSNKARKPSTSSSSTLEMDNNQVMSPKPTEKVELKSDTDGGSVRVETSAKVDEPINDDSESDESSTKAAVSPVKKPKTFLGKLLKSNSDSDRSSESSKDAVAKPIVEISVNKGGLKDKEDDKKIVSSRSSSSSASYENNDERNRGKLDDPLEPVVLKKSVPLAFGRRGSGSSSSSSSGRSIGNGVGLVVDNGRKVSIDDAVKLETNDDKDLGGNTDANTLKFETVESARKIKNPETDLKQLQLKDDVVLSRRRESEEYSSSSESENSTSLSSADKNLNPIVSSSALTDTEREILKIEIPKEDEEEYDKNSLKSDEKRIEEPRNGITSPSYSKSNKENYDKGNKVPEFIDNERGSEGLKVGLSASSSSDYSSSTETESDIEVPIQVENQADENKVTNDMPGTSENTDEGFDVFFADDDITAKKTKEMFDQINGKRVTSLTVRNCNLTSYIFDIISKNLVSENDLKKIELSGCEVEISLLKLLANAIEKWPNLKELILSGNVFVDYSLFDLVNALVQVYSNDRKTLNLFDLTNCSLQENDFSQIVMMIAEDAYVETIVLDRNVIDRKMWQDLRGALMNNTHTKSVSIKNCINDSALFDEINDETVTEIRTRLIIN